MGLLMTTPTSSILLQGDPSRRRRERIVSRTLAVAAVVTILISAFIVLALLFETIEFLRQIDLSDLFSIGWFPRRGMFDITTLLIGSLIVTLIAMCIAGPVGLLSAIYLSEYASPRLRATVKPILEILASIPSVVLGFFALTFINPQLVQRFFPGATVFNMLAAGIGVGILIIPLIASISEDALRAVPRSLREAAYGLGARRITVSLRVVVPAAISGIVAAFIIGVSRAIGETMVVAIAAGGTGGSLRTWDPLGPGQTVTAAIASLATGSDQVQGGQAAYLSLFFLGLVLFGITLGLNVLGDVVVRRTRQRY
jgi:phosphate transport system permease protein